ncbi:hypothetical protein FZEAL_3448, partial [Fusarium zealandicum]
MFLTRDITPLFIASLVLCSFSSATSNPALHPVGRRQDSSSSADTTSSNDTSTSLEPVIPPAVNPDEFSILDLDTKVTLAWAGSTTGSGSRRRLKRDDGIFSQANFTFAYPAIPLDQSTYVSGISCTRGSLTATLSNAAYTFAKSQWQGTGRIIFVTSVDGCGMDNANDLFLSTSITFSDTKKTFTAKGSSVGYKDVAKHFNLKWGEIGTLNLKRALDKRDMFEPHPLHRRASTSFTVEWSAYLSDLMGPADDAPWDNAALLFKWGKDGGEADDSYAKGEVADPNGHHKRWNESALAERALDYGLALYCVECGFAGSATIRGEIDASVKILPPFVEVDTVQAGFDATFKAGLNLGMQAFVKYEKEWEKELERIPLGGFSIPLLVDIGPFVSLSVQAKAGIEATGSLLIGAAVEWDNIDVTLDLLDGQNSHANGLIPTFSHTAQASGELKVEASLGLPVKLGIGIDILSGAWQADGSIVDTPSVVLEGAFVLSAEVIDEGTIEQDINGGCYGIAWDIHFENTLQAVIEVDGLDPLELDLIEPQESDPIAEGCIGYVDDGTSDDDGDSDGTGTGIGTGMLGNGMKSNAQGLSGSINKQQKVSITTTTKKPSATCTPSQVILNPKVSSRLTCKKFLAQASMSSKFKLGKPTTLSHTAACASRCLKNKQCVSFAYTKSKSCQLFNKAFKDLG